MKDNNNAVLIKNLIPNLVKSSSDCVITNYYFTSLNEVVIQFLNPTLTYFTQVASKCQVEIIYESIESYSLTITEVGLNTIDVLVEDSEYFLFDLTLYNIRQS